MLVRHKIMACVALSGIAGATALVFMQLLSSGASIEDNITLQGGEPSAPSAAETHVDIPAPTDTPHPETQVAEIQIEETQIEETETEEQAIVAEEDVAQPGQSVVELVTAHQIVTRREMHHFLSFAAFDPSITPPPSALSEAIALHIFQGGSGFELDRLDLQPTREAREVEGVCSGMRWVISDEFGNIVDESDERSQIACPMASIAKIMTLRLAMIAIQENPAFTLDTPIRIERDTLGHVQTANVGRRWAVNRIYTVGQMMDMVGQESDAVMSIALAHAAGRALGLTGSFDDVVYGFTNLMNVEAEKLGLRSTQFTNPIGNTYGNWGGPYQDFYQYSTPEAMARLLMETHTLSPEMTERDLGNGGGQGHTLAVVNNGDAIGKSGTSRYFAGESAAIRTVIQGTAYYITVMDANGGARHWAITDVMERARDRGPQHLASLPRFGVD